MKKILPIIISVLFLVVGYNTIVSDVNAQAATATPTPGGIGLDTTPAPDGPEGDWKKDKEVTFVGKTAARANEFLKWTLLNYEWVNLDPIPGSTDPASNPLITFWSVIRNIILALLVLFIIAAAFVIIITRGQNITIMRFIPRFIIIILLIVFSFAIVRFLYQFFDVIQGFFLNISDGNGGEKLVGPEDLLYIAFPYETFTGFRKVGIQFDESAYISLLLVKLTAITYYVMTGVLLIRKIILWFFIIISPVFPLLLFFRPLRNTAKIWIGEFFRWLLYAPLFAIFLNGLVVMWRDRIPLLFDFSNVGSEVYPTAINILLGGPGQQIGLYNSVNIGDTFALYVVALLMLWVVILLPWLLLQIFLDYINNFSFSENPIYQRLRSTSIPFITPPAGGTTPPGMPPQGPAGAGMARVLPFMKGRTMQIPVKRVTSADNSKNIYSRQNVSATNMSQQTNESQRMTNQSTIINRSSNISQDRNIFNRQNVSTTNINQETNEVMKLANLSVPKMRDIARMESSSITNNQNIRQEKTNVTNKLNQISSPSSAPAMDREKVTIIKEKLIKMQQEGNPIAASILSASQFGKRQVGQASGEMVKSKLTATLQNIANPTTVLLPQDRQKAEEIKKDLISSQQSGNPLATYILDMSGKISSENITQKEKESLIERVREKLFAEKEKGNKLADKVLPEGVTTIAQASLPNVNRVQQVSLDEYEEVKNIWKENYTNMEPPTPLDGKSLTKEEWIDKDMQKIDETINLLSSTDQNQVQQGMELVSDILPFLLIGGFSKAEVVAYLKAKQAAGKEVLGQVDAKREEDDTLLENKPQAQEEAKAMTMKNEAPLDLSDEKNPVLKDDNNSQGGNV